MTEQVKTRLRRLRRMSHFLLNRPSVSVRNNGIYFSASAVDELDIDKFQNCYLSIEDGIPVEEALRVYVEFNNDPVSDENCPIRMHKANGCMVSATSTIFNQIPRAKLLASKKRSERRIFLEKDNTINTWYFPIAPQFEIRTRRIDSLPEVKCIYQLVFRENIQRIGETVNLQRRCKEYKRDNIPFDEVRYSIMNNLSDDERKTWETYHLQKYSRDVGQLPPYNYQNGRSNH
ncbi:hypothetical protein AKH17_02820 [Pelagibacteraceae bacterium GOM-A2]|nr:hypothetical protein AKH17_02820 [Pelagibacteraceae bacterium GOM-A2]